MRGGDVVLAALPQADRRRKNRPAIFLRAMPPYGDALVCGVSANLHQLSSPLDEPLGPDDADFAASGLVSPSLIRLGFLTVVAREDLVGSIGSISPARHRRLLNTLSRYLLSDLPPEE